VSIELAASRLVPPRQHGVIRQIVRRPTLVVWALFVLASPFYVVRSGLPQPGDLLVLVLAPLAIAEWDRRIDRPTSRAIRLLVWFTAWVAIVNYGWAFVLWKWTEYRDFLIHPLFYLFNLAVFVSAILIARRDRLLFLRITFVLAFATVVVQIVASFTLRSVMDRGQLFFNNPNQLGYYALLCGCLFAMTQRRLQISRLWSGIGVAGCAYLAALSASRASLAGILVLLMVLVFSNPRTIVIGSLVAVAFISVGGPLSTAIDEAELRATTERHPKMTFAEERGYNRLWEYPEYLVLGAGEGDLARFTPEGERPRELHSSFGATLFGYGIVGIALFVAFFVRVLRGAALRESLMIVPALVYTVAHQGLRFTMFWVVLAVLVVMKQAPPEPRS
jgi:hypothetical protein